MIVIEGMKAGFIKICIVAAALWVVFSPERVVLAQDAAIIPGQETYPTARILNEAYSYAHTQYIEMSMSCLDNAATASADGAQTLIGDVYDTYANQYISQLYPHLSREYDLNLARKGFGGQTAKALQTNREPR